MTMGDQLIICVSHQQATFMVTNYKNDDLKDNILQRIADQLS